MGEPVMEFHVLNSHNSRAWFNLQVLYCVTFFVISITNNVCC
jgi:hypothetical protein